jgi:pilus assembly protein CpaB
MRHRTGLVFIVAGVLLAAATTLLVIRLIDQMNQASRNAVRQVYVVTSNRDIPDQMVVGADALVVKPFPADFTPLGAVGSVEQAIGKFANGFIAKDQVILARQLVTVPPVVTLSNRIPPGKVAVWLPIPEVLASTNVLQPGDRIDILLSVPLGSGTGGSDPTAGPIGSPLSTQTTLQNIEVFRIGQEELNLNAAMNGTPAGQAPATVQTGQNGQTASGSQSAPGQRSASGANKAVGFLVDHQDAVIIKFVKDVGGTIDLVLRSAEEQQIVRTDAVTMDALADRFRFRVPQSLTR